MLRREIISVKHNDNAKISIFPSKSAIPKRNHWLLKPGPQVLTELVNPGCGVMEQG